MEITELKNWAIENKIDERIKDSFIGMLDNYRINEPVEFDEVLGHVDLNQLEMHVHTISLNLGNWPECSYNTVSAAMRVYYEQKQIANYKVLYLFTGEAEDDYVDFL